jgi:hypothetical protein
MYSFLNSRKRFPTLFDSVYCRPGHSFFLLQYSFLHWSVSNLHSSMVKYPAPSSLHSRIQFLAFWALGYGSCIQGYSYLQPRIRFPAGPFAICISRGFILQSRIRSLPLDYRVQILSSPEFVLNGTHRFSLTLFYTGIFEIRCNNEAE